MKRQIFLGGSCNPTTWRKDTAMPFLEATGVAFYNPQVDDWHEGLVKLEADAKAESEILLFVIDGQTRAIASILEATEYTVAGRDVLLVIDDMVDGAEVDGEKVSGRQLKDLNRARSYLRDLASRHDNALVFEDVEQAMQETQSKLS
jgi:raw